MKILGPIVLCVCFITMPEARGDEPTPRAECSTCNQGKSCASCRAKPARRHGSNCEAECYAAKGLRGLFHWCPFYRPARTPSDCKTCLMVSSSCRPPVLWYFQNRYPEPTYEHEIMHAPE